LSLPGGEKPKVDLSGGEIMVLQGNTLYVFDALVGKWSVGIAIKLPARQESKGSR
jgi:hypothetical protein